MGLDDIHKEKDGKSPLAKVSLLVHIGGEI